MPRLTEQQKAIIYTRLRDRVAIRTIADELHINKNTVLLCKKKIVEHGKIIRNQGSGRPKISSAEQDEEVVGFLRNHPFKTAVEAKEETRFPGSVITARRRVRRSNIRNRCAANKIYLSDANKQRRLQFARQYANQNNLWESVVFSDEKTFQSSHNGRVRVYRPSGMRYDERYTHKTHQSGRFSVNVWGWISSRGPGVCAVIEERLNAQVYCDILQQIMLPSVRPVFSENFIFQQDNCPVHKARVGQDYMDRNNINVLPWPSKSPDLNPIENVWGEMTKNMYNDDLHLRHQQELQQRIAASWNHITAEYTRTLVLSMPQRLQSVIGSNGSLTKY